MSFNIKVMSYILMHHRFFRCYAWYANTVKKNAPRLLIAKDTDLVIEGFGGSANSYAVYAFEAVQSRQFKLAHHYHMPGQVIMAVFWNIPAVVIVRNPIDALVSLISRNYSVGSIKNGLKRYTLFYNQIWKYRNQIVLVEFKTVIQNYSEVIRLLNEKYKMDLDWHQGAEEKALSALREEKKSEKNQALPSDARNQTKHLLKNEIMKEKYRHVRTDALEIYNSFVQYINKL